MANKEKDVKENKNSKNFLKEMRIELKKVNWPTPKELLNNTVEVIIFVLIIAIIVFILDVCFDNINKYGITKFQNKIQSSLKSNDEDQENDSEEENTENSNDAESDESNTENKDESEEEQDSNATEIEAQE